MADADLTGEVRARLLGMGFREERTARSRPSPVLALVKAPGIEREAEEIARRILEQAAAGRPFREMGIVVRAEDTYVPVLRTTLERFGIPARFYFDEDLERHPAARFLSGAVDAMLGGWDHARTLAVLRLAPRFADSNAMDRFDFDVREQIPNAGLGRAEIAAGGAGRPAAFGGGRAAAAQDRFAGVDRRVALVRAGPQGLGGAPEDARQPVSPRRVRRPGRITGWPSRCRGQAAVLKAFDEALDEASEALEPGRPMALADFWRAVKAVLRLKPLRVPDGRRNVVHVLSAPEARQWVLPVVFVCGMVEKQFPQFHRQDPFFPDAARCRLNAAGIRVRTAEEFEREERALFDSAISRATLVALLSYPEFDARGDRNLPSLFLEELQLVPEEARAVRMRPRQARAAAEAPPEIQSPGLREFLRERSARQSPTRIEMYLQCPFQYFSARTLRLKEPPALPEERLDFLTQGNIVHEVLAKWYLEPRDIEALFLEEFARAIEEKRIPQGYHTERLRNAMLDDLRAFAADGRWPVPGMQSADRAVLRVCARRRVDDRGQDRPAGRRGGRAGVGHRLQVQPQREGQAGRREPAAGAALPDRRAAVFRRGAGGDVVRGLKGGVEWPDGRPEFPEGFFEQAEARTLAGGGGDSRGPRRARPRRSREVPVLRLPRRLPRGSARRRDRGGGRMKAGVEFTAAQLEAIDVSKRHLDACVVAGPGSGKTTVLVEYFRRLVEAGRGPAAHPGHHVHREGRRQHAQEAGGGVPGSTRRSAPAWSARGSRRCTASARGCCGRTRCSPAVDPEFQVADERESWRLAERGDPRGHRRAVRRASGGGAAR